MRSRRFMMVQAMAACSALLVLASTACAGQSTPNYPTKGIDLIVPFAAGGGSDITGRLAGGYLSKKWGQPINVVNLPGASAVTGTKRVMDAQPDGYTIMVDAHASSSMQGATMVTLPYKWDDRTFIARVTVDPLFFVVRADSPAKTLKELLDGAKAKPGTLKWGTAGASGLGVFAMALLLDSAGISFNDTNEVIFDSGAASVTAVAGGHTDVAAQQLSEITSLVQGGKLRALAVVMPERMKQFPDVPTIKEAGYNVEMNPWQGISGPPKLPADVVQKWADGLKEAYKDQQFIDDANKVSKIPAFLPPDEFKKMVMEENTRYLAIAEKIGIRK